MSNILPEHLQDKLIGRRLIKTCKKLESEKRRTDGYIMLLLGYAGSPFRKFEKLLRAVVGLDEGDIQLLLKQVFTHIKIIHRLLTPWKIME